MAIRVHSQVGQGPPGQTGVCTVKLSLTIDRFEGDSKGIAVLLTDDGTAINFPRTLLSKGAKAGDVLAVTIERDASATRQIAEKTKKVQDQLKASDPGGDVKL